MKKSFTGLVLVMMSISLLLIASCGLNGNASSIQEKESLDLALNEENQILRNVTLFNWDTVYIVPPYVSEDELIRVTKVSRPQLESFYKRLDDGICLLLFKDNGVFVSYILQPRNKGDFSKLGFSVFNSTEAIFKVLCKENWCYLYESN